MPSSSIQQLQPIRRMKNPFPRRVRPTSRPKTPRSRPSSVVVIAVTIVFVVSSAHHPHRSRTERGDNPSVVLARSVVAATTSATRTGSLGSRSLAFRSRFRDVIIGFAQRTTGPSVGQPRVETTGVEGVAARKTADVIIFFNRIQTDGACIPGRAQQLRRQGRLDVVIIVIIVVIFMILMLVRRASLRR